MFMTAHTIKSFSHNLCLLVPQTIIKNLKFVNNGAISAVISQHKCGNNSMGHCVLHENI